MIGLKFELCWSDFGLENQYMEITHKKEKHISNLVNAYFDDGYAHIVAITMSDAV